MARGPTKNNPPNSHSSNPIHKTATKQQQKQMQSLQQPRLPKIQKSQRQRSKQKNQRHRRAPAVSPTMQTK